MNHAAAWNILGLAEFALLALPLTLLCTGLIHVVSRIDIDDHDDTPAGVR